MENDGSPFFVDLELKQLWTKVNFSKPAIFITSNDQEFSLANRELVRNMHSKYLYTYLQQSDIFDEDKIFYTYAVLDEVEERMKNASH